MNIKLEEDSIDIINRAKEYAMFNSLSNQLGRIYYWLTERLYNELAWVYDPVSWIVSLGQWDAVRKLALNYVVGTRVLEVGFGTGQLLIDISRTGIQVTGLEFTPAMHKQADRKIRHNHLKIPRVRAITQQMPFADCSFETIISTFPAGYILDPQTWQEVSRLLACNPMNGNGRFIVIAATVSFSGAKDTEISTDIERLVYPETLNICEQLAIDNGLDYQLDLVKHHSFIVPVIIAEKSV